MSYQNPADTDNSIETVAIIGMSGRFPGAKNIEGFWQNLCNGVESITFFSDEELLEANSIDPALLDNPNFVKAKGVIEDVDLFDASFFDLSPREAELIDPQHRLFLECAWEALEDAGYDPETYAGTIGVYAGSSMNTYLLNNVMQNPNLLNTVGWYQIMLGNDKDFLPTRVSYKLNLTGPSLSVQTACSTSLVAVQVACQSLLDYQCDMALAGGVSVSFPHKDGYLYQEGMIFSPDGHCRAFDAEAGGIVTGEGVGLVVLKRLSEALADGDHIYAVIKGAAINNDGSLKVGYTAPSVEGQAQAVATAQAIAEVDPATITYVETHGTGTSLGDPIEISALTSVFQAKTRQKGFCAIGSVKTNIGHLDAAAGVAGLIKTALALEHKLIPPSLHFKNPNPEIDFANSPFYVNTQLAHWKPGPTPRRAGVSSFGIGGTNAHVVLEESPLKKPRESTQTEQLLVLSAKTAPALETMTRNLVAHLKQHPRLNLANAAYTLQVGRHAFAHRRMVVCDNADDAVKALETQAPQRTFTSFQPARRQSVVFMFTGQGSQYVAMAQELYQAEPIFRQHVDSCAVRLQPLLGFDLREVLYPQPEHLETATQRLLQTSVTQPALFVVEYALAQLWLAWGIEPKAMIGHSLGEYVAACLAGVFPVEEILTLVATRGRLMQAQPAGSMLAVPLPEEQVKPYLKPGLSLAAVNGPALCVVSGPTEAVKALQTQLAAQNVACRPLHTSHAFHSEMMLPVVEPYLEQVSRLALKPPQIPFISNVTGTWITASQATDPAYWAQHLRQTVRFADGIHELLKESDQIFLEIGPGNVLASLARQQVVPASAPPILSSLRHPQDSSTDRAFLLNTLGQLWLNGATVNWKGFQSDGLGRRIPLPTYPFERQRYLVEPQEADYADDDESKITDDVDLQTLAEQSKTARPEPSIAPAKPDLSGQYEMKRPEQADLPPKAQPHPPYAPTAKAVPQDNLEQQIASIWQNLLGIESIGLHDNFFELGGHSLLAMRLFSQIEKKLHLKFPVALLFQLPTIKQMADYLREKEAQPALRSLVPITTTGNRPPFFFIHAIGGFVMRYRDLAQALGSDQPVYALQSVGIDLKQIPHDRVEEMAAHYIKEMQSVQPHGPYFVGGLSFGGIVAYEIACQLQAQGQPVGLVAIFDTMIFQLPHFYEALSWPKKLALKAKTITAKMKYHFQNLKTGTFKQKIQSVRTALMEKLISSLDTENENAPEANNAPSLKHSPGATSRTWQELRWFNTQAGNCYRPKRYGGNVVLFRTTENTEIYYGWEELVDGKVEIYTVSGTHTSLIEGQSAFYVASKLRELMDRNV